MNSTDYVVLAVIVLSTFIGGLRGLLREGIALLSWLIGLFVAWHFSGLIEPHLGGVLGDPAVRPWAARLIILALVVLLGWGAGVAAGQFVRLSIFSGMDRMLGCLFGLLRGLVLFGIFVMLGQLLRLQGEHWWRHSVFIPYGASIANGLRTLVGEERVHQVQELLLHPENLRVSEN